LNIIKDTNTIVIITFSFRLTQSTISNIFKSKRMASLTMSHGLLHLSLL